MLRLTRPISAHSRSATRLFSNSSTRSGPLDLAADLYPAPSTASGGSSAPPLVILHGLYGSKQNWRSLAKTLAQRLERDVHALDLRNHGTSPHSSDVSYTDMAGDVGAYFDKQGLNEVALLGHSMGGKVAMSLALQPHQAIKKLIVADISPAVGPVSPDFQQYLDSMKLVDSAECKTRKEADELLKQAEPDFGVRAFLLTNLIPSETNPGTLRFRLPLQHFDSAIKEIGAFPYEQFERMWEGPALFIKGAKSKYINKRNIPVIEGFFPKARVETLDAGHWVHAERPKEFIELLNDFVKA